MKNLTKFLIGILFTLVGKMLMLGLALLGLTIVFQFISNTRGFKIAFYITSILLVIEFTGLFLLFIDSNQK